MIVNRLLLVHPLRVQGSVPSEKKSAINHCWQRQRPGLVPLGGLVIAGRAAGFAVHEAVGAKADVNRTLAKAAVLFALAGVFEFVALRAAEFHNGDSAAHAANVARGIGTAQMT